MSSTKRTPDSSSVKDKNEGCGFGVVVSGNFSETGSQKPDLLFPKGTETHRYGSYCRYRFTKK
jgi:hypothetical protein